jgi:cellulose synthase/poly-beta-1,6-N-acetylglucosamine synthase-like glycosyltransferase
MSTAALHLRLASDRQPQGAFPATGAMTAIPPRTPYRNTRSGRRPLGQILMDMKAVEPGNMLKALALRERQDVRLGDILLTRGWVSEADLMAALCLQWQAKAVDLISAPPDPRLTDRVGAEFCLAEGMIPWRTLGGATVIATSRPWDFERAKDRLPKGLGPVIMALAPERDIHAALIAERRSALIRKAETRVPLEESCRARPVRRGAAPALAALGGLLAAIFAAPIPVMALLTVLATMTLIATTALKAMAFTATLRAPSRVQAEAPPLPDRLPVVSVMVPLFRENDIAPRLIRRIGRIDYPKELLDILLVVEEGDMPTFRALARRRLPRWMRIVTVPAGPIRTKPRALNYALDFCRGTIIGVWDAEDAPARDQIHKIVRGFAAAGPETACLQGILDFYNARHNWLTRCFTIDYAVWFRAVLPGLAQLGLVVPLGGTTLFFRRQALKDLRGWDAHNVTEDADLGLRLARHGYRTELIDTVTEEEPNSRLLSWIRQRSRWQKGYAITWASHMRDPARLWRDLGPRRFWAVQVLFLGSLVQAFLAPVLWSFWIKAAGLPHPLDAVVPAPLMLALATLFLTSEVVNLTIGLWATRGASHRHLMKWVPSMHLYFPLAALSSYKAFVEWVTQPFYWDKTSHGVIDDEGAEAALLPVLLLANPVHVPAERVADIVALRRRGQLNARGRLHLRMSGPSDSAGPDGVAISQQSAIPQDADIPRPAQPAAPPALIVDNSGLERGSYVLGSTIALASRRPGIEFQPSFEGF